MHFPIPLCLYLRIYINVKGNVCVRAFVYHIQAAGAILTTFGMQVTSLMRKFWKITKKSVISLTFHWQKRDKTKHKKPGQHRVTLSVSYIMAGKFCPPLENAEFTSLRLSSNFTAYCLASGAYCLCNSYNGITIIMTVVKKMLKIPNN